MSSTADNGAETITYRIDANDVITQVSRNWASFARANEWHTQPGPENVLGHPLWELIEGAEVRHLYHELFEKVRKGCAIGPLPFRCDAPHLRRFMQLCLSPLPDGHIEVQCKLLRSERRQAVRLLDPLAPQSDDLLRICSVCKKIDVSEGQWKEIEDGLVELQLFDTEPLPQLTHSLCPECYQHAMAELDRTGARNQTAQDDA